MKTRLLECCFIKKLLLSNIIYFMTGIILKYQQTIGQVKN